MTEHNFSFFTISNIFVFIILYHVLVLVKNRCLRFSFRHNLFLFPVLPLIGTSYLLLFPIIFTKRASVIRILQWTKKYIGYPLNFWMGSNYNYITNNPSEIKVILHHPQCFNKGVIYKKASQGFDKCIAFVNSEEWKPKRKYFQNSFKPSLLKSFVPIFYQQSCKLIEELQNRSNQEDLVTIASDYAFRNFYLTSAGLEGEQRATEMSKVGRLNVRIQDNFTKQMLNPLPQYIWERFFPSGKQLVRDRIKLTAMYKELFDKKRQNASYNIDNAMPLFDLLVNVAAKSRSERDIIDDVACFTIASTETSGTSLAFCLVLVGMYPDVQTTLYKEVIDHVALNTISDEDLSGLKYAEAVILESLRLFPTLPFMVRLIGEDVDLGKKTVPKNTNFFIDIFHLHRDEKYWPDPLKFDPTRFLPENASKIIPYSFMPFSMGSRDCLGKGQAMKSIKTTLVNIIRRFRIVSKYKSVEDIALTSTILMKPEESIDCQFFLRQE